MPGAWTMWRLKASWITRRTGSMLSTSTSGKTLSVNTVSTPPLSNDLAHLLADGRVARIENRNVQLERRKPLGVAQDRSLLAEVDSAREQDEVGPDGPDLARGRSRSASPTVTSLTIAPAPSAASRAARAVMPYVSPWTVMRSPPAAELLTIDLAASPTSSPDVARRSAIASSTPTPTSPVATLVGANPWARCSKRAFPRSPEPVGLGDRGADLDRQDRDSSTLRSRRAPGGA